MAIRVLILIVAERKQCPGYHLRALVEAFFNRYKHVIADGRRFCTNDRQQTGMGVAVLVLNRMLDLVRLQ